MTELSSADAPHTAGGFSTGEWQGDILYGRNEAVGGHYVIGFRERPDVRYGLTALCVGMGMGAALLWENLGAGH